MKENEVSRKGNKDELNAEEEKIDYGVVANEIKRSGGSLCGKEKVVQVVRRQK